MDLGQPRTPLCVGYHDTGPLIFVKSPPIGQLLPPILSRTLGGADRVVPRRWFGRNVPVFDAIVGSGRSCGGRYLGRWCVGPRLPNVGEHFSPRIVHCGRSLPHVRGNFLWAPIFRLPYPGAARVDWKSFPASASILEFRLCKVLRCQCAWPHRLAVQHDRTYPLVCCQWLTRSSRVLQLCSCRPCIFV